MKIIQNQYNIIIEKICNFFSIRYIQYISFIVYKIFVDIIYFVYIGPTATYGINVSIINIVSSYLFVGISAFFIVRYTEISKISSVVLIIINMIYFVPITTYCSLGSGSSSFLFFSYIYWGILLILQLKIPVIALKHKDSILLDRCFYILFCATAFLTLYLSAKYTGFRIVTNLMEVYDTRAEAASYGLSSAMSYIQHFSSILIPLLILMAFNKKKYLFVIGGGLLLILNFSFAGHKTVLFMGIILIMGYLFWRDKMISLIVPGGVLVGILAILEEVVLRQGYIISFFFRRQGYLLALLSEDYYRFFKNNPKDIFRSAFLGKFGFESPYLLPISKVIGNNFDNQIVNYNNGLLGDVWAHLGLPGLIIMPLILIVCFRLFDMASDGINMRYLVGLGVYYAVLFANTIWSTVLLTHGFLLTCLIFFLFPRKNDKKEG